MSGYYEECLNKIQKLIDENLLDEARFLIQQELNMPYVPAEVEEKLRAYLLDTTPDSAIHILSDEKIREYLCGNENQQLIALRQLENQNVRLYLEEIQHVFDSDPSVLVRIALMEILALQQVSDAFDITMNGMSIEFVPAELELPSRSQGAAKADEYLHDWLENDNPSLLKMCEECLIKEAYLRLPLSIEEDEAQALAVSLLRYVSSLLGNEDEMKALLCEKNVAQSGTYELLLYSNNI